MEPCQPLPPATEGPGPADLSQISQTPDDLHIHTNKRLLGYDSEVLWLVITHKS